MVIDMNPMDILKIKTAWSRFQAAHPKFPAFLKAASGAVQDGSIIEVTIKTPEGKEIATNLRISREDMELIRELKGL